MEIVVIGQLGTGRESLAAAIGGFLSEYFEEVEYDPITIMVGPDNGRNLLDSGYFKEKTIRISACSSVENLQGRYVDAR